VTPSLRRVWENGVACTPRVVVLGVLLAAATAIPATADAQGRPSSLTAVVTDTTGAPLPGAAVWVGMRISALTDEAGRVTIRQIPPGEYLVRVRHDTHLTESVLLGIEPGASVEIEVELEPAHAIQLPGISVAVERRAPHLVRHGFYERKAQGLGSFVERDRIEQLGAAGDLCRVFDELRGFTAWSPDGRCVVQSRRGVSLPPMGLRAGRGALADGGSSSRLCTPTFYVDGSIWDASMVATLSPVHVEAVEGYAGPASTPIQFSRAMANSCGSIVIWMRW
jgi:hypothetical protein